MNYIPFDQSMLGQREIIIWCPNKEMWGEMFLELRGAGVYWRGGNGLHSGVCSSDRCLRITKSKQATHGSKECYEYGAEYERCLFTVYEGRSDTVDVGDLI